MNHLDIQAIKSFNTSKSLYLEVVRKGNQRNLACSKKSCLGKMWMWLGFSNASFKNVIKYLETQPIDQLDDILKLKLQDKIIHSFGTRHRVSAKIKDHLHVTFPSHNNENVQTPLVDSISRSIVKSPVKSQIADLIEGEEPFKVACLSFKPTLVSPLNFSVFDLLTPAQEAILGWENIHPESIDLHISGTMGHAKAYKKFAFLKCISVKNWLEYIQEGKFPEDILSQSTEEERDCLNKLFLERMEVLDAAVQFRKRLDVCIGYVTLHHFFSSWENSGLQIKLISRKELTKVSMADIIKLNVQNRTKFNAIIMDEIQSDLEDRCKKFEFLQEIRRYHKITLDRVVKDITMAFIPLVLTDKQWTELNHSALSVLQLLALSDKQIKTLDLGKLSKEQINDRFQRGGRNKQEDKRSISLLSGSQIFRALKHFSAESLGYLSDSQKKELEEASKPKVEKKAKTEKGYTDAAYEALSAAGEKVKVIWNYKS